LANTTPNTSDIISGLLVSKDYSYTLLDARDLGDFAGLSTSVVTQRQFINVEVSWELIKLHLESMFGAVVEGLSVDKVVTLRVRCELVNNWS
jgi:cleavage and polyadenylation specificity factor subunit 3